MRHFLVKTILIFVCLSSGIHANSQASKGSTTINLGLGSSSEGIPAYLGVNYRIFDHIDVGLTTAYKQYHLTELDDNPKQSAYSLGIMANYHLAYLLDLPEEWQFYGGLNIAAVQYKSKATEGENHRDGPGVGMQLGIRYIFFNQVAANFEFTGGHLLTGLRLGLSYQF
ncbi:MAG: outer membrane beta-barrel protein [Bacteroidota bacterium]